MRVLPRVLVAVLAVTFWIPSIASAQRISADGAMQTFDFVSNQYFDQVYFHFSPTAGTAAGLHAYDTQLEDYSAANVAKWTAALHQYQSKIEAIPADGPGRIRRRRPRHPVELNPFSTAEP